jgi:hypothetical protein
MWVESIHALFQALQPCWRQMNILDKNPRSRLGGVADGLVCAGKTLVGTHGDVGAVDSHSLDQALHLVAGIETRA